MDPFEELRTVAIRQNVEGEFPEWLLADVLAISACPEKHKDAIALVKDLIAQIKDYDPFAGTGCFNDSVGVEQIQATMRHIRQC